jgi:hypothetical protein
MSAATKWSSLHKKVLVILLQNFKRYSPNPQLKRRHTFSMMTFGKTPLSIMIFTIKTLSKEALGIMTFSITIYIIIIMTVDITKKCDSHNKDTRCWVSHLSPLCWVSLCWMSLYWMSGRRLNRIIKKVFEKDNFLTFSLKNCHIFRWMLETSQNHKSIFLKFMSWQEAVAA